MLHIIPQQPTNFLGGVVDQKYLPRLDLCGALRLGGGFDDAIPQPVEELPQRSRGLRPRGAMLVVLRLLLRGAALAISWMYPPGFEKKADVPVGEFKWLTVTSPGEPDGVQLLLEPNENPVAQTFQKALFEQGIAATSFAVEDIQQEYERLKGLGVAFSTPPTPMGPATIAVFDDTCGNLIQIAQQG